MASNFTRTTHTIRVKSKDGRFYADVEILDAISLVLPNNFEICYAITPAFIVEPNITDFTGDGNAKSGGASSTRASHMQRVTSTTNPQMFFDVEVCDAFTLTGPNNAQFCINCVTPGKAGTVAIADNTGSGLAVAASPTSTRAQHVAKLLHQTGTGKPGLDNQQVATDYTLTLLTDAMIFQGPEPLGMPWIVPTDFGGPADVSSFADFQSGPWYDYHVWQFYNADVLLNGALSPGANTNDITVYVTDPATGQQIPPDNTDPNVYVFFPETSGGPFLGKTPYTASGVPSADGTGGRTVSVPAIDMGPIWWLRALGATPNVWFWYLSPVQQPLALSYFGDPPDSVNPKWGYRGIVPLPEFPVAWILSENYPLIPMGTYGAPDLETAASGYVVAGSDEITVNWFGVGLPDGGWGVSTAIADEGALVEAGTAGYLAPIHYLGSSYYMPYGAFDLLAPSRAERLASTRAVGLSTIAYTDYGGPTPNIWELTGIEQPPLTKPALLWDPTTNPHQQPSLALAQRVTQVFADNWNTVANSLNAAAAACNADTGVPGFPNTPPPDWNWALPYGGDTVPTAQMFANGWIPGQLEVETVPITVPTINVGQLDPSVWNVEPVLSAAQTPPVRWATGEP